MTSIKNDPELDLRYVVADTLERHTLKGMVSHAGKFSCETCTAEAATTPATHWPLSTMTSGTLRTDDEMKFAAK